MSSILEYYYYCLFILFTWKHLKRNSLLISFVFIQIITGTILDPQFTPNDLMFEGKDPFLYTKHNSQNWLNFSLEK